MRSGGVARPTARPPGCSFPTQCASMNAELVIVLHCKASFAETSARGVNMIGIGSTAGGGARRLQLVRVELWIRRGSPVCSRPARLDDVLAGLLAALTSLWLVWTVSRDLGAKGSWRGGLLYGDRGGAPQRELSLIHI